MVARRTGPALPAAPVSPRQAAAARREANDVGGLPLSPGELGRTGLLLAAVDSLSPLPGADLPRHREVPRESPFAPEMAAWSPGGPFRGRGSAGGRALDGGHGQDPGAKRKRSRGGGRGSAHSPRGHCVPRRTPRSGSCDDHGASDHPYLRGSERWAPGDLWTHQASSVPVAHVRPHRRVDLLRGHRLLGRPHRCFVRRFPECWRQRVGRPDGSYEGESRLTTRCSTCASSLPRRFGSSPWLD